MKWCSGSWGFSGFATFNWDLVRESTVKPVGKPDAGNRHVRFDERGRETGRRFGVSARARPRLYHPESEGLRIRVKTRGLTDVSARRCADTVFGEGCARLGTHSSVPRFSQSVRPAEV
jgi:hypothetical protein